MPHASLMVVGLGYTGRAIASAAAAAGFEVVATSRSAAQAPPRVEVIPFDRAGELLPSVRHLVITAPPGEDGRDPLLRRFGDLVRAAGPLRSVAYLSSTGVYGDRGGGTVDERSEPLPSSDRARRRREAERAWEREAIGGTRAVDLVRLAGIYGPGRSVFDDLRGGRSRPIEAPDHAFGRIHLDDIAEGVLAALRTADPSRPLRVLNFNDALPAPSADVIREAAALLGVPAPPTRTLAEAWPGMSPMARSFWSDNRRVASERTVAALGRPWRYPTYREGLRAVLRVEQGPELAPEQREAGRL